MPQPKQNAYFLSILNSLLCFVWRIKRNWKNDAKEIKRMENKIHKANRTYSITGSNIWIGKSIKCSNYAHKKRAGECFGNFIFRNELLDPSVVIITHCNSIRISSSSIVWWPLSVLPLFFISMHALLLLLWCILCKLWCELKMLIGKSTQKSISAKKSSAFILKVWS